MITHSASWDWATLICGKNLYHKQLESSQREDHGVGGLRTELDYFLGNIMKNNVNEKRDETLNVGVDV